MTTSLIIWKLGKWFSHQHSLLPATGRGSRSRGPRGGHRAGPSAPARPVTAPPRSGASLGPRGPTGRRRNRARAGDQAQPASHGAAGARPGASLPLQDSCSPSARGVSWAEEEEATGPRRQWPEKQRSGSSDSAATGSSAVNSPARTANAAPPSPGDAAENSRAATTQRPVMSGVARRSTSRRLARVRATPRPAGSGTRRIRAPG